MRSPWTDFNARHIRAERWKSRTRAVAAALFAAAFAALAMHVAQKAMAEAAVVMIEGV